MGPLERLAADYHAWWVDLLGEENHAGGAEATGWLLKRAGLRPGATMLDCGAFVGAAARAAAAKGTRVVALDAILDFLAAGREMEGGAGVAWVAGDAARLPFTAASFDTVWSLDAPAPPRELSRVAAAGASLCLCCEAPADGRGGLDAFLEEWGGHGWSLAAHRPLTLEALQAWRHSEAELVARRPYFEPRYGTRSYLAQLDAVAGLVRAYERGEQGHGLFVFRKER